MFEHQLPSMLTILLVVDEPSPEKRFPLLKLPLEIRHRVYEQYFRSLYYQKSGGILIACQTGFSCSCLPLESRTWSKVHRPINIDLALTSKSMKDEVLAAWFREHTLHVACGCELSEHCP